MDFSNDVLIVDIANIRDDDPEHGRTRMRDGRKVRMSSIPYVDSALSALQVQVPSATILKIADYSLQYNFLESEKQEFLRRTNLEPTDKNYIYLLPLQPKKEQRKKGLFSRKPAEDPNFVEADDVILALAAEFEAFVISGDFYVDEKFNRQMRIIRDRLFVQRYNRATDSWLFVNSKEYFKTNRIARDSWENIESFTTISQSIGIEKSFDEGSDFEIRDFAFNTLIEEFWANKKVQITVHQKRKLTSLPFRNVLPSVLTSSAPVKVIEKFEEVVSNISVLVPSREVEQIPVAAQKILQATTKKTDLALPSYYAASPSILKHQGERIAVLGMIVRDGTDVFVEWVLSNLRIQVLSNSFEDFPRHGEIVRITGIIQKDNEKISLYYESTDSIDLVPFTELVQKRIKAARSSELRRPSTKWSLPSLRWRVARQQQSEKATPTKQTLPFKPNWPIPAVVPPPIKTQERQPETIAPVLNWFDAQNLEELNDFQLFTEMSSSREVELMETTATHKKNPRLSVFWKVVIGVVLLIATTVLTYFVGFDQATPMDITPRGGGIGLTKR